ncbi:bifunctional glutamate--cysteine ligase GshA/glutathione synthetase GshB [Defluviitalea saccharophila]|uniref:Bifunctional glutamate--cysteine ligase GshA/glutathione synthetase GshB n=1 Tax=Defluviitalea saccharophila TaxID=879970 RepID=A0ABZ2Y1V5_9FIRM|nr:bifunctional glutamate--cysteine ligase GshA/glutathione synthetase GshB [Candidatus Epulonipiscium sp.]
MADISNEKLELSTEILIKEARNRNIQVDILDAGDNFIRLKKGDKVEYIKQATKTSLDSYIAPLIMENKLVTKIILEENGFNVPKGITIKSKEEAETHWKDFCTKGVVIKPKNTNFGIGITILLDNYSKEQYIKGVESALEHDNTVLIEEYVPGKEYRFLVLGDEVAGILHRIPANVEGDGIHTIEELVEEKNKNPIRGEGHLTPFEKINLGKVEIDFLASQGRTVKDIPKEGETVYLRENSNISTGGESIDFTDDIIQDYKDIAVGTTKAVGAKICGVDMIIQDIYAKPNANNHSIIELNFNPAIYIHDLPYVGKNRYVEKKLLDLLGF